VSPASHHKDEGRKAARDAYAREQYEAAKEAQRREDEARRKQKEKEGK
jgi:hypothetical protein